MHYTVESILMVCITPLRKSPLCVHQQHHTTKSISAVCITPLSQSSQSDSPVCIKPWRQLFNISQDSRTHNISKFPQYASLRRDNLHSVHHSAKSISAVCITSASQALRCALHLGIKLHTAESENQQFFCLWLLLKGQQEKSF